ncbi:MAG: hypothetical protein E6Q97_30620 [Desulfurellales bacterium]|nr:MAG: hypothetical protein E6Q97_30620 [Desulfurellales bacterium]
MTFAAWNTVAANNTLINGVNIGPGCQPANLDDGLRNIMADLATAVAAGNFVNILVTQASATNLMPLTLTPGVAPTGGSLVNGGMWATASGFFGRVGGVTMQFAPIDTPVFTGNPQAPTPAPLDNDTSIATTAWVQNELMPTTQSLVSNANLTPVAGVVGNDMCVVTALATNLTINAPTSTPVQGEVLIIRIKDNGTARTLTWNTIYRIVGVTLPAATVANKLLYVGFIYNADDAKWDAVLVRQEA